MGLWEIFADAPDDGFRVDLSSDSCRVVYMSNEMTTATAHTLFGFEKLAKAHHLGTSGAKTGSKGGKQAGSTHLFDKATGRTACGKERGQMSTFSVPADITEANWDVRIGLCRTCRKHAGA